MKAIALETANNQPIANYQSLEVSRFEKNVEELIQKEYGQTTIRRLQISGQYNCHGLTFASRRTGIHDSEMVELILREDKYVEIPVAQVLAGDIILYFGKNNNIEHSGVVVEPPSKASLSIAKIFSKWGKYSERVHFMNNCPYDSSLVKYYRVKI